MYNKFYDDFIAVIQKDHIGNIIDIIKKEDDCVLLVKQGPAFLLETSEDFVYLQTVSHIHESIGSLKD